MIMTKCSNDISALGTCDGIFCFVEWTDTLCHSWQINPVFKASVILGLHSPTLVQKGRIYIDI
jgi:hypothetical protein